MMINDGSSNHQSIYDSGQIHICFLGLFSTSFGYLIHNYKENETWKIRYRYIWVILYLYFLNYRFLVCEKRIGIYLYQFIQYKINVFQQIH